MSERLDNLALHLGEVLKQRGLTLTCAESCTGGWIAKVITDIAGSSVWFDRGFVTYSNAAKQEMLGLDQDALRHGSVSEAVVLAMASGALARSRAQVAVAVSGIAGPGGGSADKPVGTVWLAWAIAGQAPEARLYQFAGERDEVRHQAVRVALDGLIERLI